MEDSRDNPSSGSREHAERIPATSILEYTNCVIVRTVLARNRQLTPLMIAAQCGARTVQAAFTVLLQ